MKAFTQHFWDAPFRALFLAAYVWAIFSVAWWPLSASLDVLKPAFSPLPLWHMHELLFGVLAAAIAGYLLTALPSWTGNAPLGSLGTKTLLGCWILARIATAMADHLPVWGLVIANTAFFGLLAVTILTQTIKSRTLTRIWFGGFVLFLGLLDGLFLSQVYGEAPYFAHETARLAVLAIAFLCLSVGGKAIPAFIRNWLLNTGQQDSQIAEQKPVLLAAQGVFGAGIIALLLEQLPMAAPLFLGSACAILLHMKGWHLRRALANPLLAALVFGYAWLPIGLFLSAITLSFDTIYPFADAVHAIAIGAMSGLIMAISGRAACHQPDGIMRATSGFVIGVALMWVTTWVRLLVPLAGSHSQTILTIAGILWCSAWIFFIIGFAPALRGPVVRPILSGSKHPKM